MLPNPEATPSESRRWVAGRCSVGTPGSPSSPAATRMNATWIKAASASEVADRFHGLGLQMIGDRERERENQGARSRARRSGARAREKARGRQTENEEEGKRYSAAL